MSYRIGIWDRDTVYSCGLMEYLNSRTKNLFKATAFSGEVALREYLCTKDLDLLIIDEGFKDADFGVPVMYVSENRRLCNDDINIYKYQSVQNIADKLKLYLGKGDVEQGGCGIYGVYSPLGRCGKTTLAKAICRHSGNSLYINMEEYPGDVDMSGNSNVFLYYLANNNPEAIKLIENIQADEAGIKCLLGVNSYMDIRQISYDNMRWLVDMIKVNMDFAKAVFDIGQAVLMEMSILSVFDKVIVPVLEDDISAKKLQLFEKNASAIDGLIGKITYVKITKEEYDTMNLSGVIEREEI